MFSLLIFIYLYLYFAFLTCIPPSFIKLTALYSYSIPLILRAEKKLSSWNRNKNPTIYLLWLYYKCRYKKLQLLVLNIFQFIYWFPIKNYLQFKQNFNAHVFHKKILSESTFFLHRLHQNETKIQLIFSCLLTLKNISPILTLHAQELLK